MKSQCSPSPNICRIVCILNVLSPQLLGVREVGWRPCPIVHFNSREQSGRIFGTCAPSIGPPKAPSLRRLAHPNLTLQLDRHNNFYRLEGLFFPHHNDPRLPLKSSLIDGELVVEVDPQTRNVRVLHLLPKIQSNYEGLFR